MSVYTIVWEGNQYPAYSVHEDDVLIAEFHTEADAELFVEAKKLQHYRPRFMTSAEFDGGALPVDRMVSDD